MIIYADILFLINFLSCYMLISIMCRFKQRKITRKRKLLSAFLSATAALVIFIANLEHYIVTAIFICTAILTVWICFGKKSLIMNALIFSILQILLGGVVVVFVSFWGASSELLIKNNIIYFDIDEKIFAIAFALSYPAVCIFAHLLQRRAEKKLHTLTIINKGQLISITALFDSGNLLKEPMSQKNVIIVEETQANKIVTQNQEFVNIPYRTISGESFMRAFVADTVIIDDKYILRKQYIGIAKGSLCSTDEYCALVGDMGGF